MLELAAVATQESIELQKEAEELEMKINYLKKVTTLILFYINTFYMCSYIYHHYIFWNVKNVVYFQAHRPTGWF